MTKVGGTEATKEFMEIHSWVNVDRILGRCFVGYLIKGMRYSFEEMAVMIFEIPESFFLEREVEVFKTPEKDWKEFCYNNLMGIDNGMDKVAFDDELAIGEIRDKKYDIVEGPIQERTEGPGLSGSTKMKAFRFKEDDHWHAQVAVCNQSSCDVLMEFLTGIWRVSK